MPGMRCAVALCSNNYVEAKKMKVVMSFHSFPKDPELRKTWILACKRSDSWNPNTSHICSAHFVEEDFETDLRGILMNIPIRRKLKKIAIPTIGLKLDPSETSAKSHVGRQDRVMRRENKKIYGDLLLHSENVSDQVPETGDTFEEKYGNLLKENESLEQKYQEIQESDIFQKNEIDKLKKDVSNTLNNMKIEKEEIQQ